MTKFVVYNKYKRPAVVAEETVQLEGTGKGPSPPSLCFGACLTFLPITPTGLLTILFAAGG